MAITYNTGFTYKREQGLSRSVRVEQIKNKSKILKFIELTMEKDVSQPPNRKTVYVC